MLAKHTTDSWVILSRILRAFINLKDNELSRTLIYVVSTTVRDILEYSGNAMGFRHRSQFRKLLVAVSLGARDPSTNIQHPTSNIRHPTSNNRLHPSPYPRCNGS